MEHQLLQVLLRCWEASLISEGHVQLAQLMALTMQLHSGERPGMVLGWRIGRGMPLVASRG